MVIGTRKTRRDGRSFEMSRFASPFDGNPIQTYLHVALNARRLGGKEADRAATIEGNGSAGENVHRSFRQSARVHPSVPAATAGKRPSLLLPPQGPELRWALVAYGKDRRRPPGGKDNDRSLRHQPSEPTVQVGRDRRRLRERHG